MKFLLMLIPIIASMLMFLNGCALPVASPVREAAVEEPAIRGYPLKAMLAYFSPNGDHLLATLCETRDGFCRPWRYKIAERTWEKIYIKGFMPRWSFGSAVYSPDGKTIALEFSLCDRNGVRASCQLKDIKLALLDVASGNLTVLPSEQTRFKPSFMPDGKALVFWGLTNVGSYSSGRALYSNFNFYQLNLADQSAKLVIKTNASIPFVPAVVFKDQERVALSAYEIRGQVSFRDTVYQYGMIGGSVNLDDSAIIGNMNTGTMQTLLAKGTTEKKIVDVSPDNRRALVVINGYKLNEITFSDTPQMNLLVESSKGSNGDIDHATYSPKDDQIVFIRKWDWLFLGRSSDLKNAEHIRTPLW